MRVPLVAVYRRAQPGEDIPQPDMSEAVYGEVPEALIMGALAKSALHHVRKTHGDEAADWLAEAAQRAAEDGAIIIP